MNSNDASKPPVLDDWKSWSPELFLANLLHELRSPVMIIKGYTKILADEEMKEFQSEADESISQSVAKIERLCERVADYRRELERKSHP